MEQLVNNVLLIIIGIVFVIFCIDFAIALMPFIFAFIGFVAFAFAIKIVLDIFSK